MDHSARTGLALLALAVAVWSTVEAVTRAMVGIVPPLQLSAARFSIGALFLLVILPWDLRRKGLIPTRRIVSHSVWMGILGITVSNFAYHYSLTMTGAAVVATMFGLGPLVAILCAAAIRQERVTPSKLVGIGLGFTGVAILSLSERSPTFSLLGLGLAFTCVMCFAAFTVFAKALGGRYSGLPLTTFAMTAGAAGLIALAGLSGQLRDWGHLPRTWPWLLYLGLGASGVTYLLYFLALERLEASKAAMALLLKPPLAAILAFALLGEPVTWNVAAALPLILAGMYTIFFRRTPAPPSPQIAESSLSPAIISPEVEIQRESCER